MNSTEFFRHLQAQSEAEDDEHVVQQPRSQRAEHYAYATARWEAERVDPAWAPAREDELVALLREHGIGDLPYSLECRRTYCRIEMPMNGDILPLLGARSFKRAMGSAVAGVSQTDNAMLIFVPRDQDAWRQAPAAEMDEQGSDARGPEPPILGEPEPPMPTEAPLSPQSQ